MPDAPSLFPPGWTVLWRDGARRGRCEFAAERPARLALTCLAATLGPACRVRLADPSGAVVEELRWRTSRKRAKRRMGSPGI